MKTRIIDDIRELKALEEDWARLWASSDSTPFQSPKWLIPWWNHFGEGALFVICVYESEKLVCLAPLYVYEDKKDGLRKLFLIGTGNTDYLDIVTHRDIPHAAGMVWREIIENRLRFDKVEFCDLRKTSLLLQSSFQFSVDETKRANVCPVFHFDKQRDFTKTLPYRMRFNVDYYTKKASKLGRLCLKSASEEGKVLEFMELAIKLHGTRWKKEGMEGVFYDQKQKGFHKTVAQIFSEQGLLGLYILFLEDRPISAIYGFKRGNVFYSYLNGYDPEYKKISPGTLALYEVMKSLNMSGFLRFDFLRGGERYKYLWGATDEDIFKRTIIP